MVFYTNNKTKIKIDKKGNFIAGIIKVESIYDFLTSETKIKEIKKRIENK